MKKRFLFCIVLTLSCISIGCASPKKEENSSQMKSTDAVVSQSETDVDYENGEEDEVDMENRKILAEALGIEENSRNLKFMVNALHTLEAGQLSLAEAEEWNGEQTVRIVAEDGTNYRIYLVNGNIDSVENVDTGEWPIQSNR